jgi:hypothetical protein
MIVETSWIAKDVKDNVYHGVIGNCSDIELLHKVVEATKQYNPDTIKIHIKSHNNEWRGIFKNINGMWVNTWNDSCDCAITEVFAYKFWIITLSILTITNLISSILNLVLRLQGH